MRSLIGLMAGFGSPWWAYHFAQVPSVTNAAGFAVCLLGLLYSYWNAPAPISSCCSSQETSAK